MRLLSACAALMLGAPAHAATCGGPFPDFVGGLKAGAVAAGHDPARVDAFFAGVQPGPKVIRADRAQSVFQKPFPDFSKALITRSRLQTGLAKGQDHATVFAQAEARFGVPRGIPLAFWGFETDFGTFQGDYNTVDALVTLAHDCRRPDLFRPQVLAALRLYELGDLDPATTTGAWAGEIGMVQMLPADILESGVDGDGDGLVTLKTSVPDAILSAASKLAALGWQPGEPWLQEVVLPAGFDPGLSGIDKTHAVTDREGLGIRAREGTLPRGDLRASVLLPQGVGGPAFLAFPNFAVLFNWNQSFVYVTTAAYFGTRLSGARPYAAGDPAQGLGGDQMRALQQSLAARGHDMGRIDGILGARTRVAVQAEQARLGLPADGWPTPALLEAL